MSRISFIVPVYNSEKYLKKCIDSLLEQNLEEMEILLINDGSTDSSQDIIDDYVKRFPLIVKYFFQENSGQAVARNVGIRKATGEFVTFVDSDDYVEKNAYKELLDIMENKSLDILCFDFFEVIGEEKKEKLHYFYNDIDNVKKYIISESSPCNKIIRKNLLLTNNIYFLENHIYEDLATIPVLAKFTSKIEFIDKRLYDYVIHENSTMRQKKYNKKLEDIFFVTEKLYTDFKNTEFTEELEYIYIEHLLHAAALRFLEYDEGVQNIVKISEIMKEKFPKWRSNKYYRKQNWKYKVVCNLVYYRQNNILKKILGGTNA